jgi:hypothetical protein
LYKIKFKTLKANDNGSLFQNRTEQTENSGLRKKHYEVMNL